MHRFRSLTKVTPIGKQSREVATKAVEGDKDVFGTLSESGRKRLAIHSAESFLRDDPDGYDKEEFDLEPRKNHFYYKYEITKYARQGKLGIRKALELFEQMKSHDHISPTVHNFSPLIYGCAKAGYTKRAFELYEESLKYKDRPTQSTVTCLLNSCAESPFPDYGLKRLDWFMEQLKFRHNFIFNKIQYHSAIKAYGKLGKLDEAAKLVKDMIENGLYPDTETFNMLLIGCASDKQSGSILGLRVFKRMKLYGIRPSIVTYRLLLRCIRDCGVGSDELVQKTLGELPAMTSLDQRLLYKKLKKKQPEDKFEDFEWAPLLSDLSTSINSAIQSTQTVTELQVASRVEFKKSLVQDKTGALTTIGQQYFVQKSSDKLPNLLSGDHLDLIAKIEDINVSKLSSAANRFLLFGGMHGYLEQMEKDDCTPDSKTFSLMLECIRRTRHDHLEYFRLAKDYKIKRDLLFYDLLIRHICESYFDKTRIQNALQFLDEMHKDGLRPNISTFESLAPGCDTLKQANQLINDLERSGFTPSSVMLTKLFDVALNQTNLRYIIGLIGISQRYNNRPTRILIDKLENKRIEVHDLLLKKERGLLEESIVPVWFNEEQITYFDTFSKRLGEYLKNVEVYEEEHPWQQLHAERLNKKKGLHEYVQYFKTLLKEKQEALAKGGKLKTQVDSFKI